MSKFYPLEVVGCGGEPQLQAGESGFFFNLAL